MTEHQHFGWAEKESKRDYLRPSERGGELVGAGAIMLAALFFYVHQAWSTGFFTSSFGPAEAFFLYSQIIAGAMGPICRFATGRRNVSRLPELIASIFWIAGSAWLLIIFPFNFAHFADVVPSFIRFLISWITNDIARVFLALGTIGGFGFIVVNAVLYRRVQRLLRLRQVQ